MIDRRLDTMQLMSMIVFLSTETNAHNARFKNGAQNAAHAKSEHEPVPTVKRGQNGV